DRLFHAEVLQYAGRRLVELLPMRAAIAFVVVLMTAAIAHACPTCGKAVEVLPGSTEGGAGGSVAERFNTSIYVLLGTVLLAMAFLAWHLLRTSKTSGRNVTVRESKTA